MGAITNTIGIVFTAILALAIIALLRLNAVISSNRPRARRRAEAPSHLMIVLGSGGHTAEMIAMLERGVSEKDAKAKLDWTRFTHRTWVVSSGDVISAERAKQFEEMAAQRTGKAVGSYDVKVVPRAREIHQPLYTAPVSCLRCLAVCMNVLLGVHSQQYEDFPDVILSNGPATATIMIFTSIILRFFNLRKCNSHGKMRTIYVESFARVKRLSLSGKLLSRVADRFFVQWPQLEKGNGRAEYIGILV